MRFRIQTSQQLKKNSGFTLVEMMITVAIFAIAFVIMVAVYVAVSTAQNRSKGSVEYLNEAQLVFEQVARLVRDNDLNRDSVACPTNCGAANQYICLKDLANNKTFLRWIAPTATQPGSIQINRANTCNSSGWSTLNDPSINIQALKFYSSYSSGAVQDQQPMTVITMTVSSNSSSQRGQVPLHLQTAVSSRVFTGTR